MEGLVDFLGTTLPVLFESDEYKGRKQALVNTIKERQATRISAFEHQVEKEEFAVIQMQFGQVVQPAIFPVVDGQPVHMGQLEEMVGEGKISAQDFKARQKAHERLTGDLQNLMQELRTVEKEGEESLRGLHDEMVTPLVEMRVGEIRKEFPLPEVELYLEEVRQSILEHYERFLNLGRRKNDRDAQATGEDPFLEYRVNLLVDNHGATGAPVIFETSPTYANLFGTVEVAPGKGGYSKTDFTRIKAGSLMKADGGFLIVEALDLLMEQGVWPALKRALRNGRIEVQVFTPIFMISITGMKPEPVPCDVKVAIVGDPYIYQLLYTQDQEFRKIFKLRADFDAVMPVSDHSLADYHRFMAHVVKKEKLARLTPGAQEEVMEHGARLAGRKDKLSTQFHRIADLIRESAYWAGQAGRKRVHREDVVQAVRFRNQRSGILEEKIQELIEEGNILIDTEGKVVGQVNGLAVIDMGDYMFGRPNRLTATVALGEEGVINIERESLMSGRIHDKGVLILTGYLRQCFAQDKPLCVGASICFEQLQSGVDGDSASSAEVYALFSALSGVPLRQDVAVTGSVNQRGEVQPIGGVNEKIEGFFRVCERRGLKGTEGVMIPRRNLDDLMLSREVVAAVEDGLFHIWAVDSIPEGLEILTGMPAGESRTGEGYVPGGIFERVDQKLADYARSWRSFRYGQG